MQGSWSIPKGIPKGVPRIVRPSQVTHRSLMCVTLHSSVPLHCRPRFRNPPRRRRLALPLRRRFQRPRPTALVLTVAQVEELHSAVPLWLGTCRAPFEAAPASGPSPPSAGGGRQQPWVGVVGVRCRSRNTTPAPPCNNTLFSFFRFVSQQVVWHVTTHPVPWRRRWLVHRLDRQWSARPGPPASP